MAGASYQKFLKEREKGEQETPAARAVRVCASVLALHLSARKGREAMPLDEQDTARLKLLAALAIGPHKEHVLPLLKDGLGWEPEQAPQGTA